MAKEQELKRTKQQVSVHFQNERNYRKKNYKRLEDRDWTPKSDKIKKIWIKNINSVCVCLPATTPNNQKKKTTQKPDKSGRENNIQKCTTMHCQGTIGKQRKEKSETEKKPQVI